MKIINKIKKKLGFKTCWNCEKLVKKLTLCSYGRCEAPCCDNCINKENGLCKCCDDSRTPQPIGNFTLVYA